MAISGDAEHNKKGIPLAHRNTLYIELEEVLSLLRR